MQEKKTHDYLAVCFACFSTILENFVRYFNRYAFSQVAIYGKSYCEAAKSTWHLFEHHGLDVVINDDIIGTVMTLSCVIGACFTATVGGLMANSMVSEYLVPVSVGCFFVGFLLFLVSVEVVDCGVATIFVCFAEQPDKLKESSPRFYLKFQETFPNVSYFNIEGQTTRPEHQ